MSKCWDNTKLFSQVLTFFYCSDDHIISWSLYYLSVFGTICTHGSLMQHYQAAEFSKEVSRLAAAPRRPSTNRM